MNTDTTIAAISTPTGEGGIGVVRISGSNAADIADSIFTAASGKRLKGSVGYSAHFGTLHDKSGDTIDQCIALVFKAPKKLHRRRYCRAFGARR